MQISKVIQEIIFLAKQEEANWVDWEDLLNNQLIFYRDRDIFIGERDNRIGYKIGGIIKVLPTNYENSRSLWNGFWIETGYVANSKEAFELIKAWLFEEKEVCDLPEREVRSTGIG